MSKKAENSKCLLLNADYSPLRIISWKKAIVWSIKYENDLNYKIEILDYYKDRFIHGACGKEYPVPAVAKTVSYFNIYDRKISFSRKNLFIRDNYTCQYCGIKYASNQLTYDHVIPKSRFNEENRSISTNWFNIVTACKSCNHKKGNRTPIEASMHLMKKPVMPSYSLKYLPWYHEASMIEYIRNCEEWQGFIK